MMKTIVCKKYFLILNSVIVLFLFGCGQAIGYQKVASEFRYYHSTDPEWLPSAAGPGGQRVFIKLENVHEDKFEIFGKIAKDDQNVWYKGKLLPGADAESFVELKGGYQKDKFSVYFEGKLLTDLKSDYFEVLKASNDYNIYARTDTNIFFRDKPLDVSSVENFEFISGCESWSRDGVNYFYLDRKIIFGTYKDLVIISPAWYKDKQFVYNVHGDTLILHKNHTGNVTALDVQSIEKTAVRGMLMDQHGYINANDNKRITASEYKFFLKHND